MWVAARAVLRGKFIPQNVYLRQEGKSQINNLSSHLKKLEKEDQSKPQASRRKEIINIVLEINDSQSRKTIQKINETKSWFFKKRNRDFPGGTVVKNLPANAGDTGSSPGPGRPHMPWSN